MMVSFNLLRLAIENNVEWCSTICAVCGSNDVSSSEAWANLEASPPNFPSVISRVGKAQNAVEKFIEDVCESNPSSSWAVKDSFKDLDLSQMGFDPLFDAHWYGGTISGSNCIGWKVATTPEQLAVWKKAWGGPDRIPFSELLGEHRVKFWFKVELGLVESGFVTFETGPAVGISNWFSLVNPQLATVTALKAASSLLPDRPLVCWSTDHLDEKSDMMKLGQLRIWRSH
jgi:hypothetical protein